MQHSTYGSVFMKFCLYAEHTHIFCTHRQHWHGVP